MKVVGPETVADPAAVREEVHERLAAHAVDATDDDLFSDRLILNRSYLVEQDDRPAFDDAIDEIEDAYGEDYHVQYTGPWAPYNFVDIRIGAEGAR